MKSFLICLIRMYQLCISSWTLSCCRYYPSCSQYAIIAIKKHGIIKGVYMSIKRILSCHPFGKSGYDPVP